MEIPLQTNDHQNGGVTALNGQPPALASPPNQVEDTAFLRMIWPEVSTPAYNRPVKSLTFKPNKTDLATLFEGAWALAQSIFRYGRFDPEHNSTDKDRQEEAQKNLEALQEDEDQEQRDAADVRVYEERGMLSAKPNLPMFWKIAGLVAFTVTIAPTLHDFLFAGTSDDPWLYSMLASLSLAVFVIWSILNESAVANRSVASNRMGLVAGLMIIFGLVVLRVSQGDGNYLFTLGMSVVEIGVMIFLERVAERHRKDLAEWRPYEAAKARLESRRNRIKKRKDEHGKYIAYVELRNCLDDLHKEGKLAPVLVRIVHDAYQEGINDVIGYMRNGPKPEPRKER